MWRLKIVMLFFVVLTVYLTSYSANNTSINCTSKNEYTISASATNASGAMIEAESQIIGHSEIQNLKKKLIKFLEFNNIKSIDFQYQKININFFIPNINPSLSLNTISIRI